MCVEWDLFSLLTSCFTNEMEMVVSAFGPLFVILVELLVSSLAGGHFSTAADSPCYWFGIWPTVISSVGSVSL